MAGLHLIEHPLIQHKISLLRDKNTGVKEFRELTSETAMLICYEATRDLKMEDVKIKTPICEMTGKQLSGKKLAVVPILRAGLGMVDGMLAMIPSAKVGHIGLYRNEETLEPVEYYCKLPKDCDACNRRFFRCCDPDVKGQGCKENSFHVHYCSTGRCKTYAGSTPGC